MIEHEKGQKEELAFQVAAASHDLKTPLTVIKGNGELLQMSLQDEKALQCVDDLLIAGNRMETYVRELIGYTKTYSVGTDQIRSCRLCDLVGELKEQAVQIVAGTKEISFAFQGFLNPQEYFCFPMLLARIPFFLQDVLCFYLLKYVLQ